MEKQDWQQSLNRLREQAKKTRPKKQRKIPLTPITEHGREAMMTLVAIMNDKSDPRLQIAAARTLLAQRVPPDKTAETEAQTPSSPDFLMSDDELDAAITVAKALLDELAARKAAGVDGKGNVAVKGAAKPDHPAG